MNPHRGYTFQTNHPTEGQVFARPHSVVLTLKSGRKVPSREIAFPGLANRHLREITGFPDLLIGISGKPPVSATCLTRFESSVWVSVITIIDSESIEMIDGRGPNVCVAISTIGVQSRFQGSLHPGRVNGK